MKTHFFNFASRIILSIIVIFCIISCQKDENKTTAEKTKEELIHEQIMKDYAAFVNSGKTITVEYTTLEEMNEVLIEFGLEPYDESEINKIIKRTSPDYELIEYLADFDENSNVSTLDLVLNLVYVKDYGDVYNTPPCGGGYINDTSEETPIDHPTSVERFGNVSWAFNGAEILRDDCDDEEIVRDFLLGYICDY